MQQKKVNRQHEKKIMMIALLAVWVCIALCAIQLIQMVRIRAQLREQREQISRTYNMVQMFHSDALEGQGSLETVRNNGQESGTEAGYSDPSAIHMGTMDTITLSYAERCGLDHVDRPQDRSPRQVLARLEELGREDERIAAICRNSEAYPERLLEALANNPEMADFAEGYLDAEHVATGGLTDSEKKEDYPLFLQWDPRWGYAFYGDNSCIALSGCGPTCLSMVLYYLTGDESLTPDVIGDYSMKNNYYLSGTGTLWALFEDVAPLYGVKVRQPNASEWEMKAALDQGAVLICSMGPGDFTAGGHFIVIYDYDKDGFLINDSNCVARSRQSWSFDQLSRQMKHLWIFEA